MARPQWAPHVHSRGAALPSRRATTTTTTTTTMRLTTVSSATRAAATRRATRRMRARHHHDVDARRPVVAFARRDARRATPFDGFGAAADAAADDFGFFSPGAFAPERAFQRELARFERDVDARLEKAKGTSSYSREQSGVERASDGSMTHRYYVSERVVTYGGGGGGGGARAPAAFGAGGAFASACWLAVGAAWAVATRKFLLGYDSTSFKADGATKLKLAAQWPALYATSGKFRKEFRAACDDANARVERDKAPVSRGTAAATADDERRELIDTHRDHDRT